jgi:Tfp pilus assembly protein PilF
LISLYEYEAEGINQVNSSNTTHTTIFKTLSSAYNNLGAVYQRQNNEAKASISYWKAIDFAKRIDRENEFARLNLARSFKNRADVTPVFDEEIPAFIEAYREGID